MEACSTPSEGSSPAGDGDLRQAVGAVDDETVLADVDAGAVAADVDHLVRVGTALDVVAGVDGPEAAGEVRPQVAEALIEAGHGGFLLVESESSGRQEGVEELEGLQQVRFMGAADDDVIGEAGVAVARVAHGPVDVGQGQVGQEWGQAGAPGDTAVTGALLAPGAPRPGDEPEEVDGARAAGDGGEGGQGVLDAEVGELVSSMSVRST